MRRLLGGSLAAVAALLLLGLFTGAAHAAVPHCYETDGALCRAGRLDRLRRRVHRARRALAAVLLEHRGLGELEPLPACSSRATRRCMPNQAGTAGTWNFQLHPAFWLGMALCDNQSAPEFTHAPCAPEQRHQHLRRHEPGRRRTTSASTRARRSSRCSSTRPAGRPGRRASAATRRKWCAAMAIFSLQPGSEHGRPEQRRLPATRSAIEPANFAFITKSGVPHAPPAPLGQTDGDVHAERGDRPVHELGRPADGRHPRRRRRPDGDRPRPDDRPDRLDDGERRQRLRAGQLRAGRGDLPPGAVHVPPDVRDLERAHARAVGGAQLQRRLLGRDRALRVLLGRSPARAATASPTTRARSTTTTRAASARPSRCSCRSEAVSPPTPTSTAPRTRPDWPGTDPNRGQDTKYHPTAITFTSPLFNGTQNYSRVAFEADLPRIEAPDSGGICDRFTGSELRQPAAGLELLPDLHDRELDAEPERERALRLAARRALHQGHDEHVRRELGGRVRAAAVQLLPESRTRRFGSGRTTSATC